MLPPEAQIVSADDHIIEPPELWRTRLPLRMRDAGPRVIQDAQGEDLWIYEGRQYPQSLTQAVVGRELASWRRRPFRFDDIRPGCDNLHARLAYTDAAGVAVETSGPQDAGLGGTSFLDGVDKALALTCVQAWI